MLEVDDDAGDKGLLVRTGLIYGELAGVLADRSRRNAGEIVVGLSQYGTMGGSVIGVQRLGDRRYGGGGGCGGYVVIHAVLGKSGAVHNDSLGARLEGVRRCRRCGSKWRSDKKAAERRFRSPGRRICTEDRG